MLFIRRLEIEDDKYGNRQLLYSDYNTEAKKGLSKAMAFVMQKEGSVSFLEYLKKDFEALSKGFSEIDEMLIGKKEGNSKSQRTMKKLTLGYDELMEHIKKNIEENGIQKP
jgi:predicted transcriptional regulator